MLEQVDSEELSEWEAYDRLEPIDLARRFELSCGIIASSYMNCHLKDGYDPITAKEVMPDWGSEYRDAAADADAKARQTANRIEDAVKSLGLTWEQG